MRLQRGVLHFFIGIFLLVVVIGFSSAVSFTVSVTPSNVDEDVSYLYNFTITNTNSTANITQINISLPSGFSANPETNGTSVAGASFSISGSVLTWSLTPLILNDSTEYFWFNATASTPGTYNFSVTSLDSAGITSTNESNIITVADTTPPSVSIVFPQNSTYTTNVSELNYTVSDNSGLSNCWYSTDNGATNSSTVSAGTNFTGVISSEGSNTWTLYCNDTSGNENSTSVTFTKDTGSPVSNLVSPSNNSYDRDTTTFSCNATDSQGLDSITLYLWNSDGSLNLTNTTAVTGTSNSTSWTYNITSDGTYIWNCYVNDTAGNSDWDVNRTINIDNVAPSISLSLISSTKTSLSIEIVGKEGTCTVDRSGASISGSTLTETGLSCGTTYAYTVTCTDAAGNSGSSESTEFSTSKCPSSGKVTKPFWTNTVVVGDIKEGYTRALSEKQRIKVTLKGEEHYVGVIKVAENTATINVSSTPQQAVLSIGEEKKFDVDNDGYYEIYVKLNGIEDNKADITIKEISEKVPAEAVKDSSEKEQISEKETTPAPETGKETRESLAWSVIKWILILAIIGVIVYFAYNYYSKRK